LRSDRFTDEFKKLRFQLQNVERLTFNVQRRNAKIPLGARSTRHCPFDVERWVFCS